MSQFFRQPRAFVREGPLGSVVDLFTQQLNAQGYAKLTIGNLTRLVVDYCCWIKLRKIEIRRLSKEDIDRYLKYRQHHRYTRSEDRSTLLRFHTLLVQQQVIAAEIIPIEIAPAQAVEEDYRHYLEQERKLADSTVVHFLDITRRFLRQCYGNAEVLLGSLCPAHVIQFVRSEAARVGPGRARYVAAALRSFLRYARYRDLISTDLQASVPRVANWSKTSIPKAISPDQVRHLLAQCDRQSTIGCRNYAILLLLARLGLRGGEVAGLTLGDVNWESGVLRIRGPGEREDYLPIPHEVGTALAEYLRRGRPSCSTRRFFVRAKAPRRGFVGSSAITDVVQTALNRAGLDPILKGSHLLRHSLATNLLRNDASLAEISEVLRHRHLQTTTVYAKVDLDSLRPLALSWPGGVR